MVYNARNNPPVFIAVKIVSPTLGIEPGTSGLTDINLPSTLSSRPYVGLVTKTYMIRFDIETIHQISISKQFDIGTEHELSILNRFDIESIHGLV